MALTIYSHFNVYPMSRWRWPNFSPAEMACRREGELAIDEAAMDKLQALRTLSGRPLIVLSAYRSKAHNAAVGGAKASQHLLAKAFDISMGNHDPATFAVLARRAGFTGFGYYPKQGFMHIDTGPARTWGTPWPKAAIPLPPEHYPEGDEA